MTTTTPRPTPGRSAARRASPWEAPLWLLAGAAVWATVGWVAAVAAVLLLVADRLVWPGRRILATAAAALVVAVPVVWFLGSSLPLFPPSVRLNDNLLAHQLGGLAVWTLFLAACVEVVPRESDIA
ncbi:hypothetical protein N798_14510 [Knoellia flava TL1]|uniref:Uncharacterized protein n=2 Tax=Knoellia flava TaxID=913969 RepID=A0A8H9FQL4_9MICO|nr:hypothetical protein [Knoellia flava]KGN29317.1 hypothetical protein N798_14510 [Knoellia flava TL1]GGB67657.1 hypothetical protein GCM10011314_03620 [Knoellia flava]